MTPVVVGGEVPKIVKPGEFPQVKALPMPGGKAGRGMVLLPPGPANVPVLSVVP